MGQRQRRFPVRVVLVAEAGLPVVDELGYQLPLSRERLHQIVAGKGVGGRGPADIVQVQIGEGGVDDAPLLVVDREVEQGRVEAEGLFLAFAQLAQECRVLAGQRRALQQLRPSVIGVFQRTPPPPGRDPGVVALLKHSRHLRAFEDGRPRVLGIFQQPRGEALLLRRPLVPQHAGDETGDAVGDGQSRDLAAGQHEIAYGHHVRGEGVDIALVDALVVAADDDELLFFCQLPGQSLVEGTARRGGDEDAGTLVCGDGSRGRGQHVRLQHHAASAAVEAFVRGLVLIQGKVPDVGHRDVQQPGLPAPAYHGMVQRREHFREQGQDVDLHASSSSPAGSSTSMVLRSMSTCFTTSFKAGMSRSFLFWRCTTYTSFAV